MQVLKRENEGLKKPKARLEILYENVQGAQRETMGYQACELY